jgi:hypothetical protein
MTMSLAAAYQTRTGGFTSRKRNQRVKTKSQSVGLLSDVREALSHWRHGPKTWYERLSDEQRAELDEIRVAFQKGELGPHKKTVARAIANQLRERGISTVGEQGVLHWLGNR